MEDARRAKKYLLAGALIGGIMSLSVSLLMDTLYADALQGTWRDAIAKDLHTFFSVDLSPKSFVVNVLFLAVLGLLSAFGALLGYIFSFFLYKFFGFLSSR